MMVDSVTEHSSDAISNLRERFSAAQERFSELYDGAKKKVVAGAKYTDTAIRENPYQSMAIALGVGVLSSASSSVAAAANGRRLPPFSHGARPLRPGGLSQFAPLARRWVSRAACRIGLSCSRPSLGGKIPPDPDLHVDQRGRFRRHDGNHLREPDPRLSFLGERAPGRRSAERSAYTRCARRDHHCLPPLSSPASRVPSRRRSRKFREDRACIRNES